MTTLEMLSAQDLWDSGDEGNMHRVIHFAENQRPINIIGDERFAELLAIASKNACVYVEILVGKCIFHDYVPSSAVMAVYDYNRISKVRFISESKDLYRQIQTILSGEFEMPDPGRLFLYDFAAGIGVLPDSSLA